MKEILNLMPGFDVYLGKHLMQPCCCTKDNLTVEHLFLVSVHFQIETEILFQNQKEQILMSFPSLENCIVLDDVMLQC